MEISMAEMERLGNQQSNKSSIFIMLVKSDSQILGEMIVYASSPNEALNALKNKIPDGNYEILLGEMAGSVNIPQNYLGKILNREERLEVMKILKVANLLKED